MCGIVGYIGKKEAFPFLMKGLHRLEYRGYDSAGVALLNGNIRVYKKAGKVSTLAEFCRDKNTSGTIGIGHTRWATHGEPNDVNAHPHYSESENLAIIHNGIIENYLHLKKKLQDKGFQFKSETDTEVVAHLIASHWQGGKNKNTQEEKKKFINAVQKALKEIRGTFALGVLCSSIPDIVIGARRDCPLIIGCGKGENFLASDVPAVLQHTRDVIFLEDGDLAEVRADAITVENDGKAEFTSIFCGIVHHFLRRNTSFASALPAWPGVPAARRLSKPACRRAGGERPRRA